jgi:hypothetical protein
VKDRTVYIEIEKDSSLVTIDKETIGLVVRIMNTKVYIVISAILTVFVVNPSYRLTCS